MTEEEKNEELEEKCDELSKEIEKKEVEIKRLEEELDKTYAAIAIVNDELLKMKK